ncbi:ribosome-associated protein [Desulfonispora thiosulfatigenes DSM 11270]|uniref:Ribosomal silencing factor RsfS n=1 Tax=Desulfonispora thiosulfatigenes DSM 11270 TaxID=656914 RepID=A0A1W1UGQ8_DESTI|nr:ribosome silencing factor [Desulfonispora thiosulfatigenes]SMB80285.1 ribosome-associated protein [Desulfonispora thiosulfatigenes DSM 11270]
MEKNDVLKQIIKSIDDKKAQDIVALDVQGISTFADYFVICTGSSNTQVKAIADNIEKELKEKSNLYAMRKEGYQQGHWVLLDYNNIIVHVFLPDDREFYDLERLWGDAKRLEIETILGE